MELTENELSSKIIGAAIEVHRNLGPGLLESLYEQALVYELDKLGLNVRNQVEIPVRYKEMLLDKKMRIDILVNDIVIVECKATSEFNEIFLTQCYTYLKLSGLKLGLVINFGEIPLSKGIHRVVNKL